jgi:hypothetical protein
LCLVFEQNLNPSSWSIETLTIIENGLKRRRLRPPKIKGVKFKKNKN